MNTSLRLKLGAVFFVVLFAVLTIIANTAMVLNILFLFAGLAVLSATLTTPGIAQADQASELYAVYQETKP